MRRLTREEVRKRLLEISRSPEPEHLHPGAMCYSPAPPPDHWVFVCPTCGKRTAYLPDQASVWSEVPPVPADAERRVRIDALGSLAIETSSALKAAKRLPKRKGLRVDTSALCASCSPDAKTFELMLEIQLPDEEKPRRIPLSEDDLLVLRAFLTGKDRYDTGMGGERSLRDELERLTHLLFGSGPWGPEPRDVS